jgi:hypothetical protein
MDGWMDGWMDEIAVLRITVTINIIKKSDTLYSLIKLLKVLHQDNQCS